ncbi:DUF4240 domain-containing protein [Lentisphaera profundi]|uniref:DUF4240 domain-containing protein n=1 Tax=Lentisphaera profundi TaxID=1658616 RepID=A0ABY7VRL3_9BACT|nr:DUF4240 domain-containing protein [Lentisphaera profundi]WDE96840.1 DUF4240 domain-containing protein [Lentisphaera profundi]
MKLNEFWQIIDNAHNESNGSMDKKCRILKNKLSTLSHEQLIAFSSHFDTMNHNSYTWPLWGAAYLLNGGCSDDSFTDFRTTLISMGKNTYSRALHDPNTLSEVKFDQNDPCYEGYEYAVNDVLQEQLGDIPKSTSPFPIEPKGEEWDEDELEILFPTLKCIEDQIISQIKPWWKFW